MRNRQPKEIRNQKHSNACSLLWLFIVLVFWMLIVTLFTHSYDIVILCIRFYMLSLLRYYISCEIFPSRSKQFDSWRCCFVRFFTSFASMMRHCSRCRHFYPLLVKCPKLRWKLMMQQRKKTRFEENISQFRTKHFLEYIKGVEERKTNNKIINFVCLCATMKLFLNFDFGKSRIKKKGDKNPLILSIRIFSHFSWFTEKFISLWQSSTYPRMNKRFERTFQFESD